MLRPWFAALILVLAVAAGSVEAGAFTRGMASKMRAMQDQAYAQRLTNAGDAYKSGDFKRCISEALQALQHASTDEKAVPVRKLLAASYLQLGDQASSSEHLAWLKSRNVQI